MTWTKEAPTVPGWYWYVDQPGDEDVLCVSKYENVLRILRQTGDGDCVFCERVASLPGQWYGPLEIPPLQTEPDPVRIIALKNGPLDGRYAIVPSGESHVSVHSVRGDDGQSHTYSWGLVQHKPRTIEQTWESVLIHSDFQDDAGTHAELLDANTPVKRIIRGDCEWVEVDTTKES